MNVLGKDRCDSDSLEAQFHKQIRKRESKRNQGYIMGAFREAVKLTEEIEMSKRLKYTKEEQEALLKQRDEIAAQLKASAVMAVEHAKAKHAESYNGDMPAGYPYKVEPFVRPVIKEYAKKMEAAKSTEADFHDAALLHAEIFKLKEELIGPDGFKTWRDAAVAERVKRVAAEAERDKLKAEREELEATFNAQWLRKNEEFNKSYKLQDTAYQELRGHFNRLKAKHGVMLAALIKANEALNHSEPAMKHYNSAKQRHVEAQNAVFGALGITETAPAVVCGQVERRKEPHANYGVVTAQSKAGLVKRLREMLAELEKEA